MQYAAFKKEQSLLLTSRSLKWSLVCLNILIKRPTTETGIMPLHFTGSLLSALANVTLHWDRRAGIVCGVLWSVLHGHCHPRGWLILIITTACKSRRRRKRRTEVCLGLSPTWSQGTLLNPESGKCFWVPEWSLALAAWSWVVWMYLLLFSLSFWKD